MSIVVCPVAQQLNQKRDTRKCCGRYKINILYLCFAGILVVQKLGIFSLLWAVLLENQTITSFSCDFDLCFVFCYARLETLPFVVFPTLSDHPLSEHITNRWLEETNEEKVVCLTLTFPINPQRLLYKYPHTSAGAKIDFCSLSPDILACLSTPLFTISFPNLCVSQECLWH